VETVDRVELSAIGGGLLTATESDNNHHVQLKRGDVFDIVLADDYATTGCQWRDLGHHDPAILRDSAAGINLIERPPVAPTTAPIRPDTKRWAREQCTSR
jgi:hypothetical protein